MQYSYEFTIKMANIFVGIWKKQNLIFFVHWESKCLIKKIFNPQYVTGEKVLCYHGPLLYEAKCLEHRVNEKVIEFKVHYAGWNKRYLH
jgi:RNA binding activity-knot of a chromodomain